MKTIDDMSSKALGKRFKGMNAREGMQEKHNQVKIRKNQPPNRELKPSQENYNANPSGRTTARRVKTDYFFSVHCQERNVVE